ncbi:hypothetical protein NLI96_g5673 [Meripilus lineatus]|uniref:Uncharacterized protein n=1 Tax=Meripilus lineatus TaxID=2056292 RepID=A0AAD5V2H5_9APHY|nr:hypothetical protein NLI96_g5673 [Physisporinus lineatus]
MLQNYHLETFWDLRRILVSRSSLTPVILAEVTWPAINREFGLPSHISAASRLLDVISIEVSSFWDVLLIWVIPTLRLSKWSTGEPSTERSPTLRRDEFAIFERLLETTTGPAKSLKFTWKYGKDGDKWDLRSGWLTQSPVVALRMSVPTEVAQLTPHSQKAIAVVHSLHYQATFDDALPSPDFSVHSLPGSEEEYGEDSDTGEKDGRGYAFAAWSRAFVIDIQG